MQGYAYNVLVLFKAVADADARLFSKFGNVVETERRNLACFQNFAKSDSSLVCQVLAVKIEFSVEKLVLGEVDEELFNVLIIELDLVEKVFWELCYFRDLGGIKSVLNLRSDGVKVEVDAVEDIPGQSVHLGVGLELDDEVLNALGED